MTTNASRSYRRFTWTIAKLLAGRDVNGELALLSDEDRGIATELRELSLERRSQAWERHLRQIDNDDAQKLRRDVVSANPIGPSPDKVATVADLEGLLGEIEWEWPGWLPRGFLTLLVAEQDSGKSLVALQGIGKSVLTGHQWPDGTRPHFDPSAKILWAEAEAAHQLLLERTKSAGLPKERILLPTDEPLASIQLDNPAQLAELRETVAVHKPRVVIFDALSGGHP